MTPSLAVADIDLTDMAFWQRPLEERDEAFRLLRAERPVSHFAEPDLNGVTVPGFWALTRYEDVVRASKDVATFTSTRATVFPDMDIFREFPMNVGRTFLDMDAPEHTKHRSLVARRFTPKAVGGISDRVEQIAHQIVEDIVELGECDFAQDVASRLPFAVTCELMGVPRSWWPRLYGYCQLFYGSDDPEYVPGYAGRASGFAALRSTLEAVAEMMGDLVALKRETPADDLTSQLLAGRVDGRPLTQLELAQWFAIIMIAGLDTTRHTSSHGLLALDRNPDQKARWLADFDGLASSAVEELMRWATPVIQFRRTTTCDVELSGQRIPAGDTVMLFYNSANRDEEVFTDAYRLDLGRDPNRHVTFGGFGPHICLECTWVAKK